MHGELDLYPEPDLGGAATTLDVRDVILDPVFGKRRDALLRTAPLHSLVERIPSDLQGYDARALALAAFDAVIARQGFPHPATAETVTTLLAAIAAVQRPRQARQQHLDVAEHVLDGLTNRRERQRQFTLESIVYSSDEAGRVLAVTAARPFWLLREQEDPATGETYLKASVDAVNALVGGLDLPVEDEQAAAEIILERQIRRGDLASAYVSAERARRLSVGFTAKVDDLLAETTRYLPGTDWKVAAPQLIEAAMAHLHECLTRESQLLTHVTAGTEHASTSTPQQDHIAERLITLLKETQTLHDALLRRLMGARRTFLDAQNAQMFRPQRAVIALDLTVDLLEPVMSLHVHQANPIMTEYLRGTLGLIPPKIVSWGEVIGALLRPSQRTRTPPAPDSDEATYRPDPPALIDSALLDATRAIVAAHPMPVRLSQLLASAPPRTGSEAAELDLLSAAALRAFDNGVRDLAAGTPAPDRGATPAAVHLLDVLGTDVACHSDGTPLEGPGWDGDDLIICADRDQLDGVLLGDIPTPAPVPIPDLRGTR